MRRTAAALVIALTAPLLLMMSTPAPAGEPVRISVDVPFDGSPGAFTAEGPGLCSGGSYDDGPIRATGFDRGAQRTFTFHLDRTFTCADGSGTFTVRLNAHWHPCDRQNAGAWVVRRGTGDYSTLSGAGRLVGTYQGTDTCNPDGVVDVLTGRTSLG